MLPVHPQIANLLPAGGLRRGCVVSVRGSTTALWMLLTEATQSGCWAGLVGLPELGLLAGLDLGIPAERLMLVPDPGPDLGPVLAALLDGVDLVAVNPARVGARRGGGRRSVGGRVSVGGIDPGLAQSITRRARHRGGVVLAAGPWPGADLDLRVDDISWTGLDRGAGYLTGQRLRLTVAGRGAAGRPRTSQITLHQSAPAPTPPERGWLRIVDTA